MAGTIDALGNALVCPQQLNYNNKWNTHIALQVEWIRFKRELKTGFANFSERLLETILKGPEINDLCVSKKVDELVLPKVMILNMTIRYEQHK